MPLSSFVSGGTGTAPDNLAARSELHEDPKHTQTFGIVHFLFPTFIFTPQIHVSELTNMQPCLLCPGNEMPRSLLCGFSSTNVSLAH